jgi:hypothetical protein
MPRGQYTRRQPITENPELQNKNIRPSTRRQMRLDSAIYEEIHKDKKLMKITDSSADLHWWLQHGAEPVPRATDRIKVYKGINDKYESEWVTWPSGQRTNGTQELTYLLMIDPDLYDDLVTIPEQVRNDEIMTAMRLGKDQSGIEAHLKGGGSIKTYAPNLPTGEGVGFNEIRARP